MMTEDEGAIVLDKTDLTILSTLARNSRSSYNSIGSEVDLTSKSVKARVKRIIHQRVIEKFVVRVNPAAFGFKVAIVLVRTGNGINKDDVIKRVKQLGDIAYYVYHMGRTCVTALIIKKPLDDLFIQSLNRRLMPASVVSIIALESRVESIVISETDLRIIKCLLLTGARTEIADIAREVGISEKTTTRRLTRMKDANILDFSIQCSPPVMIGYIQFAIPIITTRFHRQSVLEQMYSKFQANILYSPSVIDSEDRLTFVLFAENVFTVDSILTRVSSFEGVKSADVYILTKWQYHDDWIMKEINKRISQRRPLLFESIKINNAMN
jgi:DNA-binding Lrp family transcriptional regulator